MTSTRNQRASVTPRTTVFNSGGNNTVASSTDEDGNQIGRRWPRFFQIINTAIIQDGDLTLPPEFVRKYGADLTDRLNLKVPDGLTWEIKLKRDSNGGDGTVSFHITSLASFFKYYSIQTGHVLLFKYLGKDQFHVVVFDTRATEINYPADSSDDEVNHHYHHGEPSEIMSSEEEEEEEEVEEEEEEEEEDEDYCVYPSTDADESSKSLVSSGEEEVRGVEKKKKKKRNLTRTKDEDRAMRSARQRASLIGDAFKSRNPSFAVALQPSYIDKKYLPIPASFKDKGIFNHGKKIRAHVEGGGFWLLEKRGARLTVGIPSLMKDNELAVRDVVVMELMKETKSKYLEATVHIHRT